MRANYTNQEAFDTAAAHLLKQSQISADEGTVSCRYRGPNGLKCAIGALIEDEDYTPIIEGACYSRMYKGFPEYLLTVDHNLLLELQTVHDNALPAAWRQELRGVAARYNLDPKVLEEVTSDA